MSSADLGALMRDTLLVVLKLGGPLLIAGLLVGVLVSVLQAITQVHEATLAFIPKAVALGITLALMAPFMMATLTAYAHHLFDLMVTIGGS